MTDDLSMEECTKAAALAAEQLVPTYFKKAMGEVAQGEVTEEDAMIYKQLERTYSAGFQTGFVQCLLSFKDYLTEEPTNNKPK